MALMHTLGSRAAGSRHTTRSGVRPLSTSSVGARWSSKHASARAWDPPRVPTLVVVPHPDDEVLLAGGLIATQRERGIDVHVLGVTDGEAGVPLRAPARDLAHVRRREQAEALCTLGVSRLSITRLGIPDGEVAHHLLELTERLRAMATDFPLVVAPWTDDHHADHKACGRAAATAVAGTPTELLFGLFWTWHRLPPARLEPCSLVGLAIPPHIRQQRVHAIAKHRSQISDEIAEPLLTPELLEPLAWDHEFFVVPPA
jgi:LmbE family N-acetylglucosaminyl deacetylase